jgi:Cu/Ag efflux protein CusF
MKEALNFWITSLSSVLCMLAQQHSDKLQAARAAAAAVVVVVVAVIAVVDYNITCVTIYEDLK